MAKEHSAHEIAKTVAKEYRKKGFDANVQRNAQVYSSISIIDKAGCCPIVVLFGKVADTDCPTHWKDGVIAFGFDQLDLFELDPPKAIWLWTRELADPNCFMFLDNMLAATVPPRTPEQFIATNNTPICKIPRMWK